MGIIEILLLAVGLAMDAFAVSVCKGLAAPKVQLKHCLIAGIWFGGFQALMPLIGFLCGRAFESYVKRYAPLIAFCLLLFIGVKMIIDAVKGETETADSSFKFKTMLVMAIATSIDALAVGISFAVLGNVNIFVAVLLIGAVTFVISAVGVWLGNTFGALYQKGPQIAGGVILVLIGLKILIEGLIK